MYIKYFLLIFVILSLTNPVYSAICVGQDCSANVTINVSEDEEIIGGGGGGGSKECYSNSDCNSDEICVDNVCYLSTEKICEDGEYILDGKCVTCDGTIVHKDGKDYCVSCSFGTKIDDFGNCIPVYSSVSFSDDNLILGIIIFILISGGVYLFVKSYLKKKRTTKK